MVAAVRRSWLLALWISLLMAAQAGAESGRIVKVLPHFLDRYGRHTLAPSLYERDAYQAYLRKNPDRRTSMRFNVQWRARGLHGADLTLRLETRGSQPEGQFRPATFEKTVRGPRWLSRWTPILIGPEDYTQLGEVTAWRVTLWNQDKLLSEQRSFLW